MKRAFCHPTPATDNQSIRTRFTLLLLSSTSTPGWAQDESNKHHLTTLFGPVGSSQVLLYLCDIFHANVKRAQPGMKKIPAALTVCIWVWLFGFFFFFSEAFSCLSVRSSSLYSPRPKTDPATYGILSEIIQEIFPVGGLYLGIFLFILSCAWHQLQVLFLFWMERILSSIPKRPFGPFLKKKKKNKTAKRAFDGTSSPGPQSDRIPWPA